MKTISQIATENKLAANDLNLKKYETEEVREVKETEVEEEKETEEVKEERIKEALK